MLTILEQDRYERRAHAIMATMAMGDPTPHERRRTPRRRLLTCGQLHVEGRHFVLYTRDAVDDGVGYIAAGDLPPHTRVYCDLPGPAGETLVIPGEVVRTRTLATGWHEGFVRFDYPVDLFSELPIRAA